MVARIEQARPTVGDQSVGSAVFVRLRNLGPGPIAVPTGDIGRSRAPVHPELWAGGTWRSATILDYGESPAGPCRLAAGEDVVFAVRPGEPDVVLRADAVRVTVAAGGWLVGDWSGSVTTPARAAHVPPDEADRAAGTLPMPRNGPVLSPEAPFNWGSADPSTPKSEQYEWGNRPVVGQMRLYPAGDVTAWLERQLAAAGDRSWRLYLAGEAAARGSAAGRAVLEQDVGIDDDRIAVLSRLGRLDRPPAWVADALADVVRRTAAPSPTGFGGSQRALLTFHNAWSPGATDVLLGLAGRRDDDGDLILAIEHDADPRVDPFLIDLVRRRVATTSAARPAGFDLTVSRAVYVLGRRRCRAAVPVLVERAWDADVVRSPARIGDPVALPVVERLAAGEPWHGTEPVSPGSVATARYAAAVLRPGDPVPRGMALLADRAPDEGTCHDILDALKTTSKEKRHLATDKHRCTQIGNCQKLAAFICVHLVCICVHLWLISLLRWLLSPPSRPAGVGGRRRGAPACSGGRSSPSTRSRP